MIRTKEPRVPGSKAARTDVTRLIEKYVAVCNRAIAENEDRFLVKQARKLNRTLWGETHFRTLVYDHDPDHVVAEVTLHFDPDDRKLSVKGSPVEDVAFSWRVSLDYLEDVVRRPDWYVEHPVKLDWDWLTHRVRDEARTRARDRGSMARVAAGFAVGLVTAAALTRAVLGRRR